MFVSLMTILVPNKLAQIESHKLNFEPQNTDNTIRFNAI